MTSTGSRVWMAAAALVSVSAACDTTTATTSPVEETAPVPALPSTVAPTSATTTAASITIAPTTTPQTTPTSTTDPTASPEVAALCDAYLAWVNAFDGHDYEDDIDALEALLGPDAPPGLTAAFETLRDPGAYFEDVTSAEVSVTSYVRPVCARRFVEGVTPAVGNLEALETLLAAIIAGDRESASVIAATDVMARLEPWEPWPESAGEVTGDTLSALLAPTITLYCEAGDGIVTLCAFGE